MRVSETSCSLLEREGGSTVYRIRKLRDMRRYFWNYVPRYTDQDANEALDSSIAGAYAYLAMSTDHYSMVPMIHEPIDRICSYQLPLMVYRSSEDPSFVSNRVANEENEVEYDVEYDVANEERRHSQRWACCGAVRSIVRPCQHLLHVTDRQGDSPTPITKAQVS